MLSGKLGKGVRCMTERDQWSERLRCRECGATSSVMLSQASSDSQAYHDKSDQNVRVETVLSDFLAKVTDLGCQFFCARCGALAAHENSN